jgi:hypothetical protein
MNFKLLFMLIALFCLADVANAASRSTSSKNKSNKSNKTNKTNTTVTTTKKKEKAKPTWVNTTWAFKDNQFSRNGAEKTITDADLINSKLITSREKDLAVI